MNARVGLVLLVVVSLCLTLRFGCEGRDDLLEEVKTKREASTSLRGNQKTSIRESSRSELRNGTDRDRVSLSEKAGRLRVRVLDERDVVPAGSVAVSMLRIRSPSTTMARAWRTTDVDGLAEFSGLAPGNYTVEVAYSVRREIRILAGQLLVERIVLPVASELNVVVRSNGVAMEGARVWISRPHVKQQGVFVGVSDRNGNCRVSGVGAGSYIGAFHDQMAPSLLSPVDTATGMKSRVELALGGSGGWIVGRVWDVDGSPARNALVVVGPRFGRRGMEIDGQIHPGSPPINVRVDSDGTYRTPAMPAGNCDVRARSAESSAWSGVVVVRSGTGVPNDIWLTRGGAIRGRVTNSLRRPVAGARVWAGTRGTVAETRAYSDVDGRFELRGVPETTKRVFCFKKGLGRAEASLGSKGWSSVDLVIPHLRVVRGLVKTERRPKSGLVVQVHGGRLRYNGLTNTVGRFQIRIPQGEPAAVFNVRVFLPGDVSTFPIGTCAAVPPDVDCQVETERGHAAACILGKVLLPLGVPSSDVKVWLLHTETGLKAYGRLKEDGSFQIDSLVAGRYALQVDGGRSLCSRVPPFRLEPEEQKHLGNISLVVR